MNARERFLATARFTPLDRPFRWEMLGPWQETLQRWQSEGMPPGADVWEFFQMDKREYLPVVSGFTESPFDPPFEIEVLSEDAATKVYRDPSGIIKKEFKEKSEMSMPQFLEFPVSGWDDLDQIYSRMDAHSPGRFPENWPQLITEYTTRDYPLGLLISGAFGFPRNLFGDDKLLVMYYDDPKLIHDIQKHWLDFYVRFVDRLVQDVVPDFVIIWEDMAYKAGPLIGPHTFKEFMSPYYKELVGAFKESGIEVVMVDSDGNIDKLIPLFLEAGVNAFMPFEAAAGMNVVALRKQYGKKFMMYGGLDKRALSKGLKDIDKEVYAKVPAMLKEGGYIPAIDHAAPPDIPLVNYKYYVDLVRRLGEERAMFQIGDT